MEEQINELLIKQSSLELQIEALKSAMLNLKGFYIETGDGSQQGLIKYGKPAAQVEPEEVVA